MNRQKQVSQLQAQIEALTLDLAGIEGAIAAQQKHLEQLSQPLRVDGSSPDEIVQQSLEIARKNAENAVLIGAAREAIASLQSRKKSTEQAIESAKTQISELERGDRLEAAKGAIQAIQAEFNAACEALEVQFWKLKEISKSHDADFRQGKRSPESLVVFGIGSVPNLVERPDGGFAVQARDLDLFAEENAQLIREQNERMFRRERLRRESIPQEATI